MTLGIIVKVFHRVTSSYAFFAECQRRPTKGLGFHKIYEWFKVTAASSPVGLHALLYHHIATTDGLSRRNTTQIFQMRLV